MRGQQGYMFDMCIVTVVDALVAPQHRHGVIQLMVSLDGGTCSAGSTLDDLREGHAHLIAANEPHAVHGHDGLQAVVLIPQESAVARQLTTEYLAEEPIVTVPRQVAERLPRESFLRAYEERWSAEEVRPACEDFLAALLQSVPDARTAFHPATRQAVRIIAGLEQKRISADELSNRVGLSKSHFLRTFSRDMGVPLRPYLQWRRLMDAFVFLLDGSGVTNAAVQAGFSDAAHLNRVSQRAFAMNPSNLARLRHGFIIDEPSFV